MNLSGKICLGVIAVLLVPAAIMLTTMSLDIRGKWQAEIAKRQESLVASAAELAEAHVAVNELEGTLHRQTYAWGDVWDAPRSEPLSDTEIQIGVGRSRGLGRNVQDGVNPKVFVFSEAGDSSQYLGEFELTEIDTDRAAGQMIRPAYPGEVQSWAPGQYHVRDTLPPNWLVSVAELESQLILIGSKLALQQEEDRIQDKLMVASQSTLDQRLAELNGDADAADGASQQVLDGLVETLRNLENERNLVLDEVHDLRIKLVKDYLALQKTLKENSGTVEERQVNASERKPAIVGQ